MVRNYMERSLKLSPVPYSLDQNLILSKRALNPFCPLFSQRQLVALVRLLFGDKPQGPTVLRSHEHCH